MNLSSTYCYIQKKPLKMYHRYLNIRDKIIKLLKKTNEKISVIIIRQRFFRTQKPQIKWKI